jgi:hypothetical protein
VVDSGSSGITERGDDCSGCTSSQHRLSWCGGGKASLGGARAEELDGGGLNRWGWRRLTSHRGTPCRRGSRGGDGGSGQWPVESVHAEVPEEEEAAQHAWSVDPVDDPLARQWRWRSKGEVLESLLLDRQGHWGGGKTSVQNSWGVPVKLAPFTDGAPA